MGWRVGSYKPLERSQIVCLSRGTSLEGRTESRTGRLMPAARPGFLRVRHNRMANHELQGSQICGGRYNSSMAATGRIVATALTDLVPRLLQSEGRGEVVAALARGESAAVDGAWGSTCALTAAAVASRTENPLLIVLPRPSEVDDFAADMIGFLGGATDLFTA